MRRMLIFAALGVMVLALAAPAMATNGDNLIGVGPISRSMGGVGVAAPQDAISSVFANPAGMCFSPFCPGSEAVFAATIFAPTVNAEVTMMTPMGPMVLKGESEHKPFVIPAVGISSPMGEKLRFAVGAYGISGLGADYRNKGWDLDGDPSNGFEGDVYTKLEIMRFAPNLAYLINDDFSIGVSIPVVYGNLDLGSGGSHNYTVGLQLGALYRAGVFQFGVNYNLPEKVKHERVANFDAFMGDPWLDTLELSSPHNLAFGVAYQPNDKLLVEGDIRWLNWSGAKGYEDFDWNDQWVFAIGGQYKPSPTLALRAGFNYGKSPVEEHNGWDPMGVSSVQGTSTPTFGYEYLRIIGFPAIVESHLTFGLGWQVSEQISLNLEYMHAFENEIKETSAYDAITLKSTLSEDSLGLGINWRF